MFVGVHCFCMGGEATGEDLAQALKFRERSCYYTKCDHLKTLQPWVIDLADALGTGEKFKLSHMNLKSSTSLK